MNLGDKVSVKIRPWFPWAWLPLLRHGAWHAPILIINGELVSQGIVPKKSQIIDSLSNGR